MAVLDSYSTTFRRLLEGVPDGMPRHDWINKVAFYGARHKSPEKLEAVLLKISDRLGWNSTRDFTNEIRRAVRDAVRGRILLGELRGDCVALLRGERVHEPLHGCGLSREFVEELLEGFGAVREEVTVLVHEGVEVLGDVLPATMLVDHVVEVAEHLLHRLLGLG
jgi:hypothetical protein